MRAITYDRFGPASDVLRLTDLATPEPAEGELRVRLSHSGVNPSDAKARAGARPGVTKPGFPLVIPHSDGAGVVDAVGAGVDAARIGQPVWVWNGQWQRAFGTAADYIVLPAAQAVPLPEGVSAETGACLGIPGLTAAHTVFGSGDVQGKTLLVSGGAGAVGHNAVQLAKWGGAQVIATCSARDIDRVRAAGADHALDYARPDLAAQISELSGGIDRAVEVEFGTNAALLAEVMAPNATIAAYGSAKEMTPALPFGPFLFKAITIDIVLIYLLEQPERDATITRLHDALTSGGLTPAIDRILPLDQAAAAHDAVLTSGRAGAVLLAL